MLIERYTRVLWTILRPLINVSTVKRWKHQNKWGLMPTIWGLIATFIGDRRQLCGSVEIRKSKTEICTVAFLSPSLHLKTSLGERWMHMKVE